MNFTEKCLKGLEKPENIDDYIKAWERCATDVELHKFLGLDESDYNEWLTNPDYLYLKIRLERKNELSTM